MTSEVLHHRAPRVQWKARMKTICGLEVTPRWMARRWRQTSCPECRSVAGMEPWVGLEPGGQLAPEGPTASDLIRIGAVIAEAASAKDWAGERKAAAARAAWNVVTRILRERETPAVDERSSQAILASADYSKLNGP